MTDLCIFYKNIIFLQSGQITEISVKLRVWNSVSTIVQKGTGQRKGESSLYGDYVKL